MTTEIGYTDSQIQAMRDGRQLLDNKEVLVATFLATIAAKDSELRTEQYRTSEQVRDKHRILDEYKTKLDELTKERDNARAEAEQLRVQLAGCSVAALGGTSEPVVAKPGEYGWSASYGDVLALRRSYMKVADAIAASSTSSEDLAEKARATRSERDELRAESSRLAAAHEAEERRQEERIEAVRKSAECAEAERDTARAEVAAHTADVARYANALSAAEVRIAEMQDEVANWKNQAYMHHAAGLPYLDRACALRERVSHLEEALREARGLVGDSYAVRGIVAVIDAALTPSAPAPTVRENEECLAAHPAKRLNVFCTEAKGHAGPHRSGECTAATWSEPTPSPTGEVSEPYRVVDNDEARGAGMPGAVDLPEHGWSIYRFEGDDAVEFIGRDGGEPEDQSLVRDWDWVVAALNRVSRRAPAPAPTGEQAQCHHAWTTGTGKEAQPGAALVCLLCDKVASEPAPAVERERVRNTHDVQAALDANRDEMVASIKAQVRREALEEVAERLDDMPRSRGWDVEETLINARRAIRALATSPSPAVEGAPALSLSAEAAIKAWRALSEAERDIAIGEVHARHQEQRHVSQNATNIQTASLTLGRAKAFERARNVLRSLGADGEG